MCVPDPPPLPPPAALSPPPLETRAKLLGAKLGTTQAPVIYPRPNSTRTDVPCAHRRIVLPALRTLSPRTVSDRARARARAVGNVRLVARTRVPSALYHTLPTPCYSHAHRTPHAHRVLLPHRALATLRFRRPRRAPANSRAAVRDRPCFGARVDFRVALPGPPHPHPAACDRPVFVQQSPWCCSTRRPSGSAAGAKALGAAAGSASSPTGSSSTGLPWGLRACATTSQNSQAMGVCLVRAANVPMPRV